jgi:uncharacterized protein (DUF608 family)
MKKISAIIITLLIGVECLAGQCCPGRNGSCKQPAFSVKPVSKQSGKFSFVKTGAQLNEIAFPLGGIGAGCISLEGRGALRDFEIFNHPNVGYVLPYVFPMIWCKAEGQKPQCRVIQGPRQKDLFGDAGGDGFWGFGQGTIRSQGDGFPCFSSVEFEGKFPVARLAFKQKNFPLDVKLTAYSPFIPLDEDNSSMPVACLTYKLTNTSKVPVEATVALTMLNATEMADERTIRWPNQGGKDSKAMTVYRKGEQCSGLWMTSEKFDKNDWKYGTIAVTTDWPDVTYLPCWLRDWLFSNTTNHFWDQFSKNGRLDPNSASNDRGEPAAGTLGLIVKLAPGQSAELPILISWCYPTMPNNWGKTYYSKLWPDAFSAAEYFFKNKKSLTERTFAFEDAFYSSTLPDEVLDAAGANASTLHTATCLRMEDGTFWGWEGCSPREGCCAGSCTHVWNYSFAPAFLFPALHRTMRMSEYKYGFGNDEGGKKGSICFRIPIPLGSEVHSGTAASDGQLGGVIQLYRDWRICGDRKYLEQMWPGAKKALEFAWVQWDTNKDGLVDGDQHNTYDINFQGANPLTQMMYLAALKAGYRIAEYLGDVNSAGEYWRLYNAGQAKTDTLYNGEFLYQTTDCLADNAPQYQHGKGCLSDQVFGQLCAHIAGLGYVYDEAKIKSAIKAVYKYNFRSPLGEHVNTQRIYALNDEAGLLLCSWPNGGRPKYPFIYSDEVWTGIEYQVASHLIYEGFYDEGLNIVKAARARHDGVRRNPFNEYECGSHYARAMSSWGLVQAISGFRYDAVEKAIYITPRGKKADSMKCFFSTGSAWGIFECKGGNLVVMPMEGSLDVKKVVTGKGSVDVPKDSQKVSQGNALSIKVL